ncbi:MAG: hypothetical protein IJK52_12695 [Oscillospiraceae bacterium]|nr:hypothetical protein [Oscillospiraceae bacterium]
MDIGQIDPRDLPWDISETTGEIIFAEFLCPGVYYISSSEMVDGGYELYAVDKRSEVISDAAKAYGRLADGVADCLLYPFERQGSGRRIIAYEVQRYYARLNLPQADNKELLDAAAYGMEAYPEYFGSFFPPLDTPMGRVVRYKTLINGVFWAETDKAMEIIAVAYPRWQDVFTPYVMRYAMYEGQDKGAEADDAVECLCFPERAASVVLFELRKYYKEMEDSPYIDGSALMNAIYRDFPDYAVAFNLSEQSGVNDVTSLLINAAGGDEEPHGLAENMIAITKDAGFQFLRF